VKDSAAAGAIAYRAFLAGKKVLYFSCRGQSHVEGFPRKNNRASWNAIEPTRHFKLETMGEATPFGTPARNKAPGEESDERHGNLVEVPQGRTWPSAILAIKELTYRLSPSFVRFTRSFAFVGVDATFRDGLTGFRGAARQAAVGKTGFVRLQLELF
jgi:hypothetical protein